jgi:hypothetical protein
MKKITLIPIKSRPGMSVLLDTEVVKRLHLWGWSWCLNRCGYPITVLTRKTAAITGLKWRRLVQCSHVVIWAVTGKWPEKGQIVDHIHHNPLDNRYSELKLGSPGDNHRNRVKTRGASSRFKWVNRNKKDGKFLARVCCYGKSVWGAYTKDEKQAARAGDCIAHLFPEEFLLHNFPLESFDFKWRAIGERQRNRILKCLEKKGFKVTVELPRISAPSEL